MIAYQDIRAALAREIQAAFPGVEIYDETQPDEFARPSFWLTLVADSRTQTNLSTTEVNAYFTVVCFLPCNEYGLPGEAALADRAQALAACFSQGILRVGERYLKIQAGSGGQDGDAAYCDLQLQWREENGRKAPALSEVRQIIADLSTT